jgi:hypothetical protein
MTQSNDSNAASGPDTNYKVGKVIEKYDLEGMSERLERYWVGDTERSYSLRELAEYFNREVLRVAMERAGLNPPDPDLDSTYEVLTGSDVSTGDLTQKRRELERADIDVDELTDDFVTHQAVHTYLKKGRGVEPPSLSPTERVEKERETLQRLQSRMEAVADDAVGRLRQTDRMSVGDYEVLVDVRILCTECGNDYEVVDLLSGGGCDCQS